MQNIFITFEADSPQYLYTRNHLHFHERGDIQYFIDLQTIIRAKRDCKFTKTYPHSQYFIVLYARQLFLYFISYLYPFKNLDMIDFPRINNPI